ncbi:MAG: hypothetical protein JNJ45_11400 [Chthonomonas sp.]|nr:hypothetical protein [Chthonomonas sp.]
MKAFIGSATALAALTMGGIAIQGVRPIANPDAPVAGLDAHETHGSLSLIGQFRTSVSGWLWVRTDLYLHNGVQMRPMLDQEKQRNVVSENSHDGLDEEIGHAAVVTVIPSRERDFRGIFGDIERATSSYKDMRNHSHNDPKGALPLFRLMTWIDPQFIPGWTVGASVMCREKNRAAYDKALAYLEEGLRANPNSITLLKEIAYTYVRPLDNLKAGKVYLDRARAAIAPADVSRMDEDTKVHAQEAYRWLVLVNRDLGLRREALDVAQEGLTKFPGDHLMSSEAEKLSLRPRRRTP